MLVFFCILLTFAHCSNINKANEKKELAMPNSTVFNLFFEKFATDSIFQYSSVNFHITYYSYDIEDKLTEIVINQSEWYFIDFSKDEVARNNKVDAYEIIVEELDNGQVIYVRRGIDNGILIQYFFEYKGIKWGLFKIIDRSN